MLESSREVFRLEYHTSDEIDGFWKISGGLCLPELTDSDSAEHTITES